jgi:ketosteroid isomerase-like protein
MPAENVEAVKAVYEEWGRGNFRAGVDLYDPQVLLVLDPQFPESGTYLGADGIARYMRTFLEAWEKLTVEAEEFLEAGESVIVTVVQGGMGRSSGATPADLRYFQVWTFRAGRVIRLDVLRDRSDALEAAGISE